MVTKLKVYDKKDNVVGEAELNEDGTSKVTINNLEPNTVYLSLIHISEPTRRS